MMIQQKCENEAEWLEARRAGLGASDAAALFDEGYDSKLSLYVKKLGIGEDEPADQAMDWGHRLESKIAEWFAEVVAEERFVLEDLGRYTLCWSETVPSMFATMDRLIWRNNEMVAVLEIKKVSAYLKDRWEKGPPRHVWIQVQQQLAVSGLLVGYVAALFDGNEALWWKVERDDDFIAELVAQHEAFMGRLARGEPPAPDGSEQSSKALKRMYPMQDPGLVIDLPGEVFAWDAQLLNVKESLKELEAKKDELENLIKASIGSAEIGVLADGTRYSWKAQTRASYVVQEATFRVLRRSKKG